jgi:hypothetical protein
MTVTMAAFVKMGFLYSAWLRYAFLLLILRELPVYSGVCFRLVSIGDSARFPPGHREQEEKLFL